MTKSERRRQLLKTLLEAHPDPVDIDDVKRKGEKPALVLSYVDEAVEAGQVASDDGMLTLTERGVAAATVANPGAAGKSIKRAKAAKKAKRAEPAKERKAPRKKAKADPAKASMKSAKQGTMTPRAKPDKSGPRRGRSKLEAGNCSVTRGGNAKFLTSEFPAWQRVEPLWSHERKGVEIAAAPGDKGVKAVREGNLVAVRIERALLDGGKIKDGEYLEGVAGRHPVTFEDGILFVSFDG